MNEMEQADGLAVDYQVFQVTLQTQVVLGMTLQMIFVTKNWTLINFAGTSHALEKCIDVHHKTHNNKFVSIYRYFQFFLLRLSHFSSSLACFTVTALSKFLRLHLY